MNIYWHPEKFGLEILATLDTAEAYSFDTTILFRNKTGSVFVLHDSGCSCPTPFENMGVSDLIPISNRFELRRFIGERHYQLPNSDVLEFLNKYPS